MKRTLESGNIIIVIVIIIIIIIIIIIMVSFCVSFRICVSCLERALTCGRTRRDATSKGSTAAPTFFFCFLLSFRFLLHIFFRSANRLVPRANGGLCLFVCVCVCCSSLPLLLLLLLLLMLLMLLLMLLLLPSFRFFSSSSSSSFPSSFFVFFFYLFHFYLGRDDFFFFRLKKQQHLQRQKEKEPRKKNVNFHDTEHWKNSVERRLPVGGPNGDGPQTKRRPSTTAVQSERRANKNSGPLLDAADPFEFVFGPLHFHAGATSD